MKRQLTIFMAFVLCFTALLIPASAADATPKTVETVNRISLSDGGYIIEEIIESPVLSRASGTKSGEKISTRYTSDNKAVYAVKVTGTFQYTGTSAKATYSSATVYVYLDSASYVSKSASYSSNYASATGKVKYLGSTESRTVTLYCDKNGNLS